MTSLPLMRLSQTRPSLSSYSLPKKTPYTPYSARRAFFLTSNSTLLISSTLGNVGCFRLSGSSIAKKSCDRPPCTVPVEDAAIACSSVVFAFFAVSSSSISAFVRFLPFPLAFVGSGAVGSVVEVDLDDDAGYGIEGGEMSSMDAVRATAASHSDCQHWSTHIYSGVLALSRSFLLFFC